VYVPDNAQLNFGYGDFTVEAWVNTTVNEQRTIAAKYDGTAPDWRITITDDAGYVGRVRATIEDPNRSDFYGPDIRVDDGNWHHVVVVFDRAVAVRIYVDGVAKETASPTAGSLSNTAPLRIGGSVGFPPLNGTADEVAVYGYALAPARIRAHFATGYSDYNSATSYATAVGDHQPVGYWRLNDPSGSTTAVDSSGNGFTGTWRYGAFPGGTGALRSDFGGTSGFFAAYKNGWDDVYVPDNDQLDFGTGDFTIEAWVNTSYNQERTIVAKYDGTTPNWRVTVTDDGGYVGRVRLTIEDPNRSDFYGPDIRVDDGKFHHIAVVVRRGVSVRIYVDGIANETPSPTIGTLSNYAPVRIGATANYPPMYGNIDEVALYRSALRPDQVNVDYEAGIANPPYPYGKAVLAAQPVAFWRLDEAAGATAARSFRRPTRRATSRFRTRRP
jgi:hypothetical protein